LVILEKENSLFEFQQRQWSNFRDTYLILTVSLFACFGVSSTSSIPERQHPKMPQAANQQPIVALAPPLDLSHHFSLPTTRRNASAVKKFYKYFSIPGIHNLAGGGSLQFLFTKAIIINLKEK
jgi:hypothetical protein